MRRLRQLNSFGRIGIRGQPWGWTNGEGNSVADPYAAYLLYDNFVEAADTVLPSHTPDKDSVGAGWAVHNGVWTVRVATEDLICASAGGDVECEIDVGTPNHVVEVELTLGGGTIGVLIGRWTDANNQLALVLFEGTDTITLYRIQGGGVTQLDTAGIVLAVGTPYRLRLTVGSDNVAHGFVDDVELVSSGDVIGAGLGTRIGLESGTTGVAHNYIWAQQAA